MKRKEQKTIVKLPRYELQELMFSCVSYKRGILQQESFRVTTNAKHRLSKTSMLTFLIILESES